jgi:hypothetical protein
MAVIIYSSTPLAVLNTIRLAISKGEIRTWSADSDGDFTHTTEQWRFKAWFRPKVLEDRIIFSIITPKNTKMSKATYAMYHGHFVEMLLNHVDTMFSRAETTALPRDGDLVRA